MRIHVPELSRRESLKALAAAGLCATAGPSASYAASADIKDEDIFQFALNLEYMEAEYYLRATTMGIDTADVGSDPGTVKGGHKVPFQSKAIRAFAEELAENELGARPVLSQDAGQPGGEPASHRFRGWVRGCGQRGGPSRVRPLR